MQSFLGGNSRVALGPHIFRAKKGGCLLGLDQLTGCQVVETVGHIDDPIGDGLVVGPSVGGVHAVSLDRIAQGSEGGVLVVEEFHKDMFQLAGGGVGGKQGGNPPVIGGEAAPGGLGRGMERCREHRSWRDP